MRSLRMVDVRIDRSAQSQALLGLSPAVLDWRCVMKRVAGQCPCPECSAAAGARLLGERLIKKIVWRRGRWRVVIVAKRIKRGAR